MGLANFAQWSLQLLIPVKSFSAVLAYTFAKLDEDRNLQSRRESMSSLVDRNSCYMGMCLDAAKSIMFLIML